MPRRTNPIESHTRKLQLQYPLEKGLALATSAAGYAYVVRSGLEDPLRTALEAFFITGFFALTKLWLFPSNPRPLPKKAPVTVHASEVKGYVAFDHVQRGGVQNSGKYPCMDWDKWRVFCYKVAYEGVKINTNNWTSNGGGGAGFMLKSDYKELRANLLRNGLVRWKYETNHDQGLVLTDDGWEYFKMMGRLKQNKPMSTDEFRLWKDLHKTNSIGLL